jgi:hypothetical protein
MSICSGPVLDARRRRCGRVRVINARLLGAAILLALISGCGGSSTGNESASSSSSSSGGSGPSGVAGGPFWIPYTAASTSGGGQTGLFVIPSNALASAPEFVTTMSGTNTVAEAQNFTLTGSQVTDFSPALMMYTATDASGNEHLFGLNLSDTTVAPVGTQISNLLLNPSTMGSAAPACDETPGQTDLTKPTTLFVLVDIPGPTGCQTSFDTFYVVHYSDLATTAPSPVTVPNPYFTSLYAPNGTLGGMVLFDQASTNLYFYANDAFTNPTILLSGVTGTGAVFAESVTNGGVFTGSEFITVTLLSGAQALYQITYSGTATKWYTTASGISGSVSDASNFYFIADRAIWQEAIAGGTPVELLDDTDGTYYILVGSNGSLLVLDSEAGAGQITSTLSTIPVGTLSSSTTPLGNSYYPGPLSIIMAGPSGNSPDDLVLITVNDFSLTVPTTVTYSTQVLTPAGTVKQDLTADSSFAGVIDPFGDSVLEVSSSGTLNSLDLASLMLTPITTTGGEAYEIGVGGSLDLHPLSTTISAGPEANPFSTAGFALDASSNVLYPVNLANTSINLAWF